MTNETRWPKAGTWEESVLQAFEALGESSAHLKQIYERVKLVREAQGLKLNPTYQCTIRRTLQQSSLFTQEEIHSGVWALTEDAQGLLRTR
jgi:hypothetical protein